MRRLLLPVLTFVLGLTTVSPLTATVRITNIGSAGTPLPIFWDKAVAGISWSLSKAGSKTLTLEEAAATIRRAFDTWQNVPTAAIRFIDQGTSIRATAAQDGVNLMIFDPNGTNLQLPPGAGVIAATLIHEDPATGAIRDVDIVFNERDFIFTIDGAVSRNSVDLEGVAAHEIGHLLGLSHTALFSNNAETPTMHPFISGQLAIEARTLQPDDIAGVSEIYPTAAFTDSLGVITGRVLRADGRSVFGASVVAHDPVTGAFVIGGITGYKTGAGGAGEYRISGLPPGEYIVSIAPIIGTVDESNFGGIFQNFDTDFPVEFFENVSNISVATRLTVTAGGTLQNIDFITGIYAPGFPEIIPGAPLANTPDTKGPYPVSMQVIDDSPLTAADLIYRINSGAEQRIVIPRGDGSLTATIPGQPAGAMIEYALEAENERGNRSRWPANGAFQRFDVLVPTNAPVAYMTMREANTVLMFDAAGRRELARIAVGQDPISLTLSPDGERLYVVNLVSNTLEVIDTRTNRSIATIPTGLSPISAVISPDNRLVYVNNSDANTITVIDAVSLTVRRTITFNLGSGDRLLGFARSLDGRTLYTADIAGNRFLAVNAATGDIVANISTVSQPRWVAVSPDGTRIYVTSFDGGGIGVIDAATLRTVSTIDTNPATSTFAMTVSEDGLTGYATDFNAGNLVILDLEAGTVVAIISTGGQNPRNLRLSPDGRQLYVNNQDSDNLFILDTRTRTQLALIDVLDGPRDIQFGNFSDIITGINDVVASTGVPQKFRLRPNYPNPFNPETTIVFELPRTARVTLRIYDLLGRRVRTLLNDERPAGISRIRWDSRNDAGRTVAAGVYMVRLKAGPDFTATRTMLLLR